MGDKESVATQASMTPPVTSADGVPPRTWNVRGRSISIVPPNIHDPRLRVSAVILSVHTLGQLRLDFHLSVPQIALTLLTCALIDVLVTLVRESALIWPGSALLTGGGISLVLRVPSTVPGEHWSLHGWYWFVGVGAFGMATKYLIRYRGVHVFNPSNVALVVAFLVFGSERIEPLDFWWGPLGWSMTATYLVIVVGGLWIGRRLDLTAMAAAFWVTLAAGMGVLVIAGHSITARWSFVPLTGAHFWWIIMTSPEVLIFLFFMITDPRTVPAGRVARVAFATTVGVLCTLLIAPQGTEFSSKVALLSGLVIVCAFRPRFDRYFPAKGSAEDQPLQYVQRRLIGRQANTRRVLLSGTALVAALAVLSGAIVVASLPARPSTATAPTAADLEIEPVDLDQLPMPTIGRRVEGFQRNLETPDGARALVETLGFMLSVEGNAIFHGDADLLASIDHGDRLTEIESLVADAVATGQPRVPFYAFDSLELIVVFPQGAQSSANAGIVAVGTREWVTYADDGEILDRTAEPLSVTFTLRPIADGGWQLTDTLDPE